MTELFVGGFVLLCMIVVIYWTVAVIRWLAITLVATKLVCHFAVKAGQPATPRALLIGRYFRPSRVRKHQLTHCPAGRSR